MCVDACGGQMSVSDPLDGHLHMVWEPNSGPLKDQHASL